MEMIINRETLWHEGFTPVIVPAGEVVWRELIHCCPDVEQRWMKPSILQKKNFFKLKFVPIKIRGWWAIIDSTWLSAVPGPVPTAAPTALPTRRPTKQRTLALS